jgi:membrane-associated phospholipid phosphatase
MATESAPVATPQARLRLLTGALAGLLATVCLVVLAMWIRGGFAPLRRLDHAAATELHGWVSPRPAMVVFLRVVDIALHPWVFRVGIAVLVVLLFRRGARRLAWWAAVTMVAGTGSGLVLQLVFARERPTLPDPVGFAPGFSFPSRHALNSMVATLVVLLVVLPALSRAARLAACLLGGAVVLLVGFDRIALGVHYVSDVVGAWLLAAALVAGTAAAFEAWRPRGGRAETPRDGRDVPRRPG